MKVFLLLFLQKKKGLLASALGEVHGEAAQGCLFVLALHVGTGLSHGGDDLVEADAVGAVAVHGQGGGGDGLDGAEGVAFDAGDLHEAPDGIAGHAEVVFHADFSGVFDLGVGAAEGSGEAGCGHRAGDTDFALAADFGAGDRGVEFEEAADGGGGEDEGFEAFGGAAGHHVAVVAQHGGDDAGGAVGGGGDDAAAGGVFLVHGDGEEADAVHGGVGQFQVGAGVALDAGLKAMGAALDLEAAGEFAFGAQAAVDGLHHGVDDAGDVGVDFAGGADGAFVGADDAGDREVGFLAADEEFLAAGEWVGDRA